MDKFNCVVCSKSFEKYRSQVKNPNGVTCSSECRKKHLSNIGKGKNNPNYKTGLYSEPSYCKCGKKKDIRAFECSSCSKKSFPINKELPDWKKDLDQLQRTITESKSYLELAKKLGTSRKTIREFVEKNGYNIDHFNPCSYRPMGEKILSKTTIKRYGSVKKYIIENGLVENKCSVEICNITDKWLGKPVVLELHHVDGNPYNNELNNLVLLCPMCHSQTENYKGRNV